MDLKNIIISTIRELINEELVIDITKNTEPAPYRGNVFGQDVEPKGTYVLQGKQNGDKQINGKASLKKPMFINVDDNNLIGYKRDLSTKYKAKGKRLSDKLMNLGYDSIITVRSDGTYGEIVLLQNASFMLG